MTAAMDALILIQSLPPSHRLARKMLRAGRAVSQSTIADLRRMEAGGAFDDYVSVLVDES